MQIQWEKTRFEPKKNVGKTGFMGFSENDSQICCSAPIELKLTG